MERQHVDKNKAKLHFKPRKKKFKEDLEKIITTINTISKMKKYYLLMKMMTNHLKRT
jgi:hypothetical protein